MTFEQLQKKIIVAEKTKEEALQSRESLTSLMHKMEKKYVHSFLYIFKRICDVVSRVPVFHGNFRFTRFFPRPWERGSDSFIKCRAAT